MLRHEPHDVLIVAYQQGDVLAFEIILTRHEKAVYNCILRFVGSRDTAEELLPETFLSVIKRAASYELQFKDIAEIVGVPENTVKSRMRYALEKLRLELEEYADMAKALQG